ncbi:MAG TPA: hypothetical protein VLK33_20225 [Terriglobales bacterium]|nr:hypothetical protein [Terriglobales bacterium]
MLDPVDTSKKTHPKQITVMDLILGIAFCMPTVAAVSELKHSGGGISHYLIAIPLGLSLGALIVWVDWKLGKTIWLRYQGYPKRAQDMLAIFWILVDLLWIIIGGFLGIKLAWLMAN